MARKSRLQQAGRFWHITSRGNNRQNIFLDDSDRNAMLGYIGDAADRMKWALHGYTLMTNHLHLVIEAEIAQVSAGMHSILTRYAKRFNFVYSRTGHAIERRFGSEVIETERHMVESARYVVLNPVRALIVDHPGEYKWTSFRATAGLAAAPPWLQTNFIRQFFHQTDSELGAELFRKFVESSLSPKSASRR